MTLLRSGRDPFVNPASCVRVSWTSATAAVIPAVICSMSDSVLMYGGMV